MKYERTEVATMMSDCPMVVSSGMGPRDQINFMIGPMYMLLTASEARALAAALAGHAEKVVGHE